RPARATTSIASVPPKGLGGWGLAAGAGDHRTSGLISAPRSPRLSGSPSHLSYPSIRPSVPSLPSVLSLSSVPSLPRLDSSPGSGRPLTHDLLGSRLRAAPRRPRQGAAALRAPRAARAAPHRRGLSPLLDPRPAAPRRDPRAEVAGPAALADRAGL